MKPIEIPTDLPRKELFAFLLKNKAALIQQKKTIAKESAGFAFVGTGGSGGLFTTKGVALKMDGMPMVPPDAVLNVKAIINTSNFMDRCNDCHIPGLWSKSLSENKMLMHLQEHEMEFEKIIADGVDLKAYTKNYTWKELGFDYKGKTEALVFDSVVREARNPYMYDQYLKGYVRNHSVCMMYVKMVLCVNEPDDVSYGAEFEAWQKYFPEVANKDDAESAGYFWAILEAKAIEGSAVPIGANMITPTISVTTKGEPPKGTPNVYALNIGVPVKGFKIGEYQLKNLLQ